MKTVHSKPRSTLKHIIFGAFTLWMLYYAIFHDVVAGYIFGGVLGFFTLIDILFYGQTVLTLHDDALHVRRTAVLGTEMENYRIQLKDIRAADYEVEVYDPYYLIFHFFLEVLFPTGRSTITVLLMDGKKKEIFFDGDQPGVREFLKELPDRSPNGGRV